MGMPHLAIGRYRGSNFTATGTVSPAGMVEASYHHQYTDTVSNAIG